MPTVFSATNSERRAEKPYAKARSARSFTPARVFGCALIILMDSS